MREESEVLREHIAGLEIRHDENVSLTGNRRFDALDLRRLGFYFRAAFNSMVLPIVELSLDRPQACSSFVPHPNTPSATVGHSFRPPTVGTVRRTVCTLQDRQDY